MVTHKSVPIFYKCLNNVQIIDLRAPVENLLHILFTKDSLMKPMLSCQYLEGRIKPY